MVVSTLGARLRRDARVLGLLLGSFLLLACGDSEEEASKAGDGGARPRGDSTSFAPADGPAAPPPALDLAPLPETCPCPLDAYCDLSSNSCVIGCKSDEHCSQGKRCDTSTELCQLGCRSATNCANDDNPCTDLACVAGSCVFQPNSAACADDGNSCTADVCSGGSCTHPAGSNGQLCGASKVCSDHRCKNGACLEAFFKAGTSCPDDGDVCTADSCDGQGTCAHSTLPDGSECPSSSGTYEDWAGTTGCGCDGSVMKWWGWYSGYQLDHSEYCTSCEHESGDYCHSCYDLP